MAPTSFVHMLLNDLLQVRVIVLICLLIFLDSLYINILHSLIRLLVCKTGALQLPWVHKTQRDIIRVTIFTRLTQPSLYIYGSISVLSSPLDVYS